MIIGIFGANGRTGKFVVDEAIARGHKVVAGVRNNNTLATSENLTIIECDILDQDQVNLVVSKSDVLVSVIGHVKNSPEFVQSEGIKNIIQAMQDQGKKRLVSLTGTGVRLDEDKITLMDRILNLSIRIIDPKRVADGIKHTEIIMNSNTDWTILRVLKLQNTKSSKFVLKSHGPTKVYVSRVDVAKSIIDVLDDNSFIHEAPILSKV